MGTSAYYTQKMAPAGMPACRQSPRKATQCIRLPLQTNVMRQRQGPDSASNVQPHKFQKKGLALHTATCDLCATAPFSQLLLAVASMPALPTCLTQTCHLLAYAMCKARRSSAFL